MILSTGPEKVQFGYLKFVYVMTNCCQKSGALPESSRNSRLEKVKILLDVVAE